MKKKIVTVLMTAAIGTSMLAGQTVMAAETTTETAAETKTDEDKGTEAAEEVQKYDMQITFEDETTATLHTLPFGDTEEAELHLEGDVAYIIFDSKDLKKSVNTKETEQALAPKPTEAPVQQSSSQTEDYSYDSSEDYSYDYDYSYDEGDDGDYDDSGDSAAEGGDDGCLDNAILN